MPKASPMLDEIDAAVASVKNVRPRTWFDDLPSDAQELLTAARDKFHKGGYQIKRFPLAGLLVEYAAKQGWKTCDKRRMSEWLAKN